MDEKRRQLINSLIKIHCIYNFDAFKTSQLEQIYKERSQARFKLCNEILEISTYIKDKNNYDFNYLYYEAGNMENLKEIKKRLLEKKKIKDYIAFIKDLANILDIDYNNIVKDTINRKPSTIDDYKMICDILLKRIDDLYPANTKDNKRNYTKDYALGDDPIFSEDEYEYRIPADKLKDIINTLDKLRKNNKSTFLSSLTKEEYRDLLEPYKNLDKNYKYLSSDDFKKIIKIFNMSIDTLEIDTINENEFRYRI